MKITKSCLTEEIYAGVSGFTDAERGITKESRSYDPALKIEPNTAKYPAQVVGVIEPCAGEIAKRSPVKVTGMGVRSESAGYPRRELEQRYDELACIGSQQRGQHEHRSQQQLWVSWREHSLNEASRREEGVIVDSLWSMVDGLWTVVYTAWTTDCGLHKRDDRRGTKGREETSSLSSRPNEVSGGI